MSWSNFLKTHKNARYTLDELNSMYNKDYIRSLSQRLYNRERLSPEEQSDWETAFIIELGRLDSEAAPETKESLMDNHDLWLNNIGAAEAGGDRVLQFREMVSRKQQTLEEFLQDVVDYFEPEELIHSRVLEYDEEETLDAG